MEGTCTVRRGDREGSPSATHPPILPLSSLLPFSPLLASSAPVFCAGGPPGGAPSLRLLAMRSGIAMMRSGIAMIRHTGHAPPLRLRLECRRMDARSSLLAPRSSLLAPPKDQSPELMLAPVLEAPALLCFCARDLL